MVTDFQMEDGKARPVGPGETRSVFQWRRRIERHGVPQSDAGGWIRHNEVNPANLGKRGDGPWLGSGRSGAYTDQDVRQVRSVLVESDDLPRELQLAYLARAALPILAITDSGGRSYQALVQVASAEEGKRLLTALRRYGWDPCNHNASRLSRLPGALRKIRARDPEGGVIQRLIYLNHSPDGTPIL